MLRFSSCEFIYNLTSVDGRPSQIHTLTFDLEVTQNDAQYPFHNDTYAHAKFKVATSNR